MSTVLRAITIRQPWAWLIVNGYKTIENRSWNSRFRGRVLIHASASRSISYHEHALIFVQTYVGGDVMRRVPAFPLRRLDYGGIVGAATVVDVLAPMSKPANPWHVPGDYGLVLADPEPLEFYPCKGMQSAWWGAFEVRGREVVEVPRR